VFVWRLEGFKAVRVGVLGGPVVVTSDPAAHFRASQKPLQMHPAWKPLVPQRKGGPEPGGHVSAVIADTELHVH